MAARWGTGEEILNACNMEYFSSANLVEAEILQDGLCGLQHHGLDTGDTLEALNSSLDPSILSIFEHSPTGEVKIGVDEESEATLLTALTEILDNIDDENLSPFDTLPDSELLQGHKGHEHTSLKKFMSLSCSPSGKETVLSSRQFPGKSLPFPPNGFLQRCDTEEYEDGSSSILMQDLDASMDELDWCLPVLLEQDGESVPVTLSELVRRMHPCSMTVCVEGQEQLLPEGGIVLEVVDKGEHGEPILAIPDFGIPISLPYRDSTEGEQRVPESIPEQDGLKSEVMPEEEPSSSKVSLVMNDKMENVVIKQPKKEFSKKCPSKGRRKKSKIEGVQIVEGRVLRSASSKKVEQPIKTPQEACKKKKKVTFAPVLTVSQPQKAENSTELKTSEMEVLKESSSSAVTTTRATAHAPPREACAEVIQPKSSVSKDNQIPIALSIEKSENEVSSKEELTLSQQSEPKPKSLSLHQYRLLRQHKKPSPPEETRDNSTKWPSLPEAPKELPPIPCLPDPSPRDPRRTAPSTAMKESVPEVMPAWQPRGPTAPPTPEALLIPPASMLASSKKPEPPKLIPSPASKPAENSVTTTSPLIQPNPKDVPVSNDGPQNTIPMKVSPAAMRTPLEVPVSLPVATTNGVPKSLIATGEAKCLQVNSYPSKDQVIKVIPSALSSKSHNVSKPHPMTEMTTRATTNVQTLNYIVNKSNTAVPLKRVGSSVSEPAKPTLPVSTIRPTVASQYNVAPIAQPLTTAPIQVRIMKLAEQMRMASAPVPKAKSQTAELIESFTTEIGIEAADLTSLLEQFEETQPKEEECLPEVYGRAAAVGNSSVKQQAETKVIKKASSPDLGSTAGLTPPATPPHQMWKPLAPVTLLAKPKKSEESKPAPTKAIQIDPRPLTADKLPSRPQASVTLGPTQPFSLDHDYCLLPKETSRNELGSRWNVKQQAGITIKSIQLSSISESQQCNSKRVPTPAATEIPQKNLKAGSPPLCESKSKRETMTSPVIVTPDTSPDRMDSKCSLQDENDSRHHRFQGYSKCSPNSYNHKRGRSQRKYRSRLCSSSGSRSSSSESSRSRSPSRKRYRSGRTESCSRSRSRDRSHSRSRSRSISPPRRRRYSCSSSSYSSSGSWSRSQSRSRSRSRSRSPTDAYRHWNTSPSPNQRSNHLYDSRDHNEEIRRCKDKAIEERRVVYVGRIHGSMTRKELRERFSYFGEIEDCTVHFREQGDNYGFVTYYNTKDAFNAIENGSKLRQPNELPFDLCFGGRRQFCRTSYADLDSNQVYDPVLAKRKFDALDFDTLLKQAQRSLKR